MVQHLFVNPPLVCLKPSFIVADICFRYAKGRVGKNYRPRPSRESSLSQRMLPPCTAESQRNPSVQQVYRCNYSTSDSPSHYLRLRSRYNPFPDQNQHIHRMTPAPIEYPRTRRSSFPQLLSDRMSVYQDIGSFVSYLCLECQIRSFVLERCIDFHIV